MKTLTISLLLACASLAGHAQQPGSPAPVRTEEYCQLQAFNKFNGKVILSVDYGQQQKLLGLNIFRNAQGQPIEFNSVIDALNWLNTQGWEFVNAYVTVDGGSSTSYYVLRRRLRS